MELFFTSDAGVSQKVRYYLDTVAVASVPEPSSLLLLGLGLAGLLWCRKIG